MVCLRGKAGDFAKLTVREDERRGPEFIRYQPMPLEKKAALRDSRRRPERLNRPPLGVPAGLPGLAASPGAPIGPTGPAG
jgi:hypothetical protein